MTRLFGEQSPPHVQNLNYKSPEIPVVSRGCCMNDTMPSSVTYPATHQVLLSDDNHF